MYKSSIFKYFTLISTTSSLSDLNNLILPHNVHSNNNNLNLINIIQSSSSLTTLLIFYLVTFSNAFNIDQEYPIVITNNFNGKSSHFGASLVLLPKQSKSSNQHETDNGNHNNDKIITGFVFIGAPKANCTVHSNHLRIFEPGLVWRCSLGTFNNNAKDKDKLCQIVEMDPTGEYDPFDTSLPFKDRKDGGWLGGSMFSGDSDKFVTCASRWINQKFNDHYLLNGICYWANKTHLQAEATDSSWPWLEPKLSYRLSPLLNQNNQQQSYNVTPKIGGARPNKTTVFDWAFGQFGFSLHITPNDELIVGAVGIHDWTGSIVYFKDTLQPRTQFGRYNAQANSSTFSEVVVVRPQLNKEKIINLQSADYFGYSVTSGKYFKTNNSNANAKTQFAAGAPRASHLSGKVLIFTVEEVREKQKSNGRLKLLVEPIEGKDTKKGGHYGSYFGQSLLSLDVNGDGFDDLLVGAPLYGASLRYKRNVISESEEQIDKSSYDGDGGVDKDNEEIENDRRAKMKSGDEGCVFIYLSDGKDFGRNPQVLCGDTQVGARFGTAMASLKDLNFDGYNDVAIGAPYEKEGRGAVYIYHGTEQFLTFKQKLEPETIDSKIRSFGWALSFGVDIDNNGYPDLAVGAYETNQVIIYRTIPIIHFTASLTSAIPKVLTTTSNVFNLTSCLSYSSKGHGKMPSALRIWVKLSVDIEKPEGKRLISFIPDNQIVPRPPAVSGNSISATSSKVAGLTTFSSIKKLLFFQNEKQSCYNFTTVWIGTIEGIPQTVPIKMEYWMEGAKKTNPDEIKPKPVHYSIQQRESDRDGAGFSLPVVSLNYSTSEFADFSNKLPLPAGNIFSSENLILPVGTICEADGDPECLADMKINAFLVDYKSRQTFGPDYPFLLGSVDILTLTVELINHKEAANLPIFLSISWHGPRNVSRPPFNCNHTIIRSTQNQGHFYICSIRRPIYERQKETFTIELGMSNVYGEPEDRNLNIFLEANTSSRLISNECKTNLIVPLRTQLRPENFSHVNLKMEYNPKNYNQSNSTFGISQAFEIGLEGPSNAAWVQVELEVPKYVEINGKFEELIGIRKPIVDFDGQISCSAVNGSFLDDDQVKFVSENGTATFNVDNASDEVISEVTKSLRGTLRRRKRYTKTVNELPENSEEILKINCSDNDNDGLKGRKLICFKISCIMSHVTPQRNGVIELKLKMFNKVASLLLDSVNNDLSLEEISTIWIVTGGTVKVLDSKKVPFGPEGRIEFVTRLGIPPPYDLPAWILIVSVAGGLLALLVVTFVLKQCGFFRRSQKEQLLRHRQALFRLNMTAAQSNLPLPGTSSTARVRTSSSSVSSRRKKSFNRKDNDNKDNDYDNNKGQDLASTSQLQASSSSSPYFSGYNRPRSLSVPVNLPLSSSLSPRTIAKQREMPGAMDLNELRRLYAHADQNELY